MSGAGKCDGDSCDTGFELNAEKICVKTTVAPATTTSTEPQGPTTSHGSGTTSSGATTPGGSSTPSGGPGGPTTSGSSDGTTPTTGGGGSGTTGSNGGEGGLSSLSIVGIIIGVIVGFLAVTFVAVCCYYCGPFYNEPETLPATAVNRTQVNAPPKDLDGPWNRRLNMRVPYVPSRYYFQTP
jgi:hypothetical protein